MSGLPLRNSSKEGYWKPVLTQESYPAQDHKETGYSSPVVVEKRDSAEPRADVCRHCGTEFVVRSPFCRMCGWRSENYEVDPFEDKAKLDFRLLRRKLNLSTSALVCLIVGLGCLGASIAVGFIFSANTLVDWQAIQIWRIEWLLATAVALLAGILLNRRG